LQTDIHGCESHASDDEQGIVDLCHARRDRMTLMFDVDKRRIEKTTAKAETKQYKSASRQTASSASHQRSARMNRYQSCSPSSLLRPCHSHCPRPSILRSITDNPPQGMPRVRSPLSLLFGDDPRRLMRLRIRTLISVSLHRHRR
jgi:hypothetical protein